MNYMLDASALTAFLNGEAGKPVVKDLLTQASAGNVTVYMSIVNFTEVYYDRLKLKRPDLVEEFLAYVTLLPITIIETVSKDIALEAGRIKVAHKMSLADSFLLAAAAGYSVTVVTSDYGELEAVEQNMPLPFLWIRPKPDPKQGKPAKADLQTVIAERDKAVRELAEAKRRIAELEAQ
jgi:predicted nucleic acid-binding protein